MTHLKSYAFQTDQGPYLHLNEDDVSVDLVNKSFSIFDGFGGSGLGDQAVRIAKETLLDFYNSFSKDYDKTLPFFFNPRFMLEGNALVNAFRLAHQKILEKNHQNEKSLFAGVSAISMIQKDNLLFAVSSGNCQALKISRGKIEEVIAPDNYRHFKADKEEAAYLSAPMNALGLFPDLEFRTFELKIFEGEQILLLSDGVYAKIELDEVLAVLNRSELSHSDKLVELFSISNERGNQDNQSGILLNF